MPNTSISQDFCKKICNNHIIHVDEETALLLNFADKCYVMSGGMFDVSSGILRRAWHFDGSDRIAEQSEIDKLLPFVGWEKVRWRQPIISLPMGMELDFGGIGKEYAVDKAWHFQHRFMRKILAHTCAVFINLMLGRQPLDFDGLVK